MAIFPANKGKMIIAGNRRQHAVDLLEAAMVAVLVDRALQLDNDRVCLRTGEPALCSSGVSITSTGAISPLRFIPRKTGSCQSLADRDKSASVSDSPGISRSSPGAAPN